MPKAVKNTGKHNKGVKLIVQIPCLNEEKTLPLVLKSIPNKIEGVSKIEILVIDDGSSDKTIKVARQAGVKHIIRHTKNMGLGIAFHDGINRALELGADIVVNTDGDNQYPQSRIGDLIKPILKHEADIVIADRQTHTIDHFSPLKKLLQRFVTYIVNVAASTDIEDAGSGFRAYSRNALLRLNTTTRYSYTMETIVQAGNKNLAISSIKIKTNPKLRESRLFKSHFEHSYKQALAIIRSYVMYRPYILFTAIATVLFTVSMVLFIRYLVFAVQGERGAHIQSLLLGSIFFITSILAMVIGVIADLIRINRLLIEQSLEHLKRLRFNDKSNS